MDEPNYLAEQQYLAAERDAEIRELMSDPEYYEGSEPKAKAKGASA